MRVGGGGIDRVIEPLEEVVIVLEVIAVVGGLQCRPTHLKFFPKAPKRLGIDPAGGEPGGVRLKRLAHLKQLDNVFDRDSCND